MPACSLCPLRTAGARVRFTARDHPFPLQELAFVGVTGRGYVHALAAHLTCLELAFVLSAVGERCEADSTFAVRVEWSR